MENNVFAFKLLAPKDASKYTAISISSIQKMRLGKTGPNYIKIIGKGKNTKILYPIEELDRFLKNHLKVMA